MASPFFGIDVVSKHDGHREPFLDHEGKRCLWGGRLAAEAQIENLKHTAAWRIRAEPVNFTYEIVEVE